MINQIAMQGAPKDDRTGLTLPLTRFLDRHELTRHRALVAVELEVMAKKTDRFGWDRDRGTMAHDRMIADWMDALQDFPLNEVQAACRAHVLSEPKRTPNEGDIIKQIMAARQKIVAALPKLDTVEPERKKADPDAVAEILARAGYAPKRFVEPEPVKAGLTEDDRAFIQAAIDAQYPDMPAEERKAAVDEATKGDCMTGPPMAGFHTGI